MAKLTDLPEELLSIVFQNLLQTRISVGIGKYPIRNDLAQLCLASSLFFPAAQQILYSCFWSDKERETWRIRAFLRTIIANPSLALHVKSLWLYSWRAWDEDCDNFEKLFGPWNLGCDGQKEGYDYDREYSTAQNYTDKKLFRKAIRDLALTNKTFWRSAVLKDIDEVYVALLILLLPNLRTLSISVPSKCIVLQKALDHATLLLPIHTPLASLQGLEEFCYYLRENHRGSINDLAPVFRLPSVRKISAHINNTLISSAPWHHLPERPNLETLKLHCHDIEPEVIGSILHSSPGLKCFIYSESGVSGSRIALHPQQFGRALMNAASSLEEIRMERPFIKSGVRTVLGSFRSFNNLKHLSTGLQWLLNDAQSIRMVEILPPALQELRLMSFECYGTSLTNRSYRRSPFYCRQIISQFRELVDAKSSTMPNLRSVGDWICSNMHLIPAFFDLVGACRAADVALMGSLPNCSWCTNEDLRCVMEYTNDPSLRKRGEIPLDVQWAYVEDEARCEGVLEV